jgi:hypothetical protein
MKTTRDGQVTGRRPFSYFPAIEFVYTENYHGTAGDVIRVLTNREVKVQKVLVSIESEKQGQIEQGQASWCSKEGRWRYKAKGDLPKGTDFIIEATAVGKEGYHTVFVGFHRSPKPAPISRWGQVRAARFRGSRNRNPKVRSGGLIQSESAVQQGPAEESSVFQNRRLSLC